MSDKQKPLQESLIDWFAEFGVRLGAAFYIPIVDEGAAAEAEREIDPDFKKWVRGDPAVAGNTASQYGDNAPGYMTRTGLGSLEIGATHTPERG